MKRAAMIEMCPSLQDAELESSKLPTQADDQGFESLGDEPRMACARDQTGGCKVTKVGKSEALPVSRVGRVAWAYGAPVRSATVKTGRSRQARKEQAPGCKK